MKIEGFNIPAGSLSAGQRTVAVNVADLAITMPPATHAFGERHGEARMVVSESQTVCGGLGKSEGIMKWKTYTSK